MRPSHSTIVLLAALLANAAAILFFRFFITLDGPMHVLHGSLQEAPWDTPGHMAEGITYNVGALQTRPGDLILMVLLLFFEPEYAHDLFAVFVSSVVVLSVVAYLRAHGTRMNAAVLWLAPLTFNIVLIMGLFHFLLGVAVSFGTMAWWKWHEHTPRLRWTVLLIGGLFAWSTHRSAPILLCTIFIATFLIELASRPTTSAKGGHRSPLFQGAIIGTILLVGALALDRILSGITLPLPREPPAFNEALLLLPLLLLDPQEEQWTVRAIGVLLLVSTCVAAWARTRMMRTLLAHDVPLLLFLFFGLIAWLGNTPYGRQLLIAERCQSLALVALAMWLAAIAGMRRGLVSKLIATLAVLVLPLHVVRVVQAEGSLYQLQRAHDLVIEAADALAPGSLVVPVMAGPDALLQHLEAYVAIRHSGILLTANEGLQFKDTSAWTDPRLSRMTIDPIWLARHWRNGISEEVDQILFIGSDIERAAGRHPWPGLLAAYRPSFDNGYARIYTALQYSADGTIRETGP